MSIKDFINQYGKDPSVGLSISHNIGDSDNGTPVASIGNSYSISDNTFSIGSDYNESDGNISSGSTYNNGSDNTIAI
ncbi:hypothetical protein L195_g060249, partial [Trifolium pratense]